MEDDFNITDSSDEGGCFVWMGVGCLFMMFAVVLLLFWLW